MADVAPKKPLTPPQKIAQRVRMLGAAEIGVQRAAYSALVRTMETENMSFSDLGNLIEQGGDGKYTEDQMLELAAAVRAEAVEAGIKIGLARARNGGSNGHLTLPKPVEMAEYCHDRLGRLKDDKQREFVSDIYAITQRGMSLSLGRLGYLASIYIQIGGRT